MNIPRLMIAGTHSGVGKTTITTAIMSYLTRSGYSVQPYKVGPDFIDPSYHTAATGNRSRNLDAWMMSEQTLRELFLASAVLAEIAVIEGVMGVFDGSSGTEETGSSAHIAKILNCPVVLIVDVKSMARSAAAVVSGFKNFDPDLNIAGVILNRIGSERHLKLVTEAIEKYCGIPVLGFVKKNAKLELPSRHLGLVPTIENGQLTDSVNALADEIKDSVNLNKLLEIAQTTGEMDPVSLNKNTDLVSSYSGQKVRIGIAMDEAFSFYYQDGLEVLQNKGAELVTFSPLHDKRLPENLDGLYIGGGFPEVFIDSLADNQSIKAEIKKAGIKGMPVFAECGGLMYLSEDIVDFNGKSSAMVGLVPGSCIMEKKLVGMGYVEAEALTKNVISLPGKKIRGHEFHYSRLETTDKEFPYAFKLVRNRQQLTVLDGYAKGNILASYLHLHFASDPHLAQTFIENCKQYRLKSNKLV